MMKQLHSGLVMCNGKFEYMKLILQLGPELDQICYPSTQ